MSPPPPIDPIITASDDMLGLLRSRIPSPPAISPSNVAIVHIKEGSVGLGKQRGVASSANFRVQQLKGLRLEGRIRFQLWASDPSGVEAAAADLHIRLQTDRTVLWEEGFLHLNQGDAHPSSFQDGVPAWRKFIDYDVLYEHRYRDSDGASSLIARIPIHSDLEMRNSAQRETDHVTDSMVRWDLEDAPKLVLRGPSVVMSLSMLVFPVLGPGSSAGPVRVVRTHDRETTTPPNSDAASLEAFLAELTDPVMPLRHEQFEIASIAEFRQAFQPAGDPVILGEFEQSYQPLILNFNSGIRLKEAGDRLEIYLTPDTATAPNEVVYLKAN